MLRLSRRDTLLLILFSLAGAVIPTLSVFISARFLDELISLVASDISNIRDIQNNSTFVITLGLTIVILVCTRLVRNGESYMISRFQKYHIPFFELQMKKQISELDIIQLENSATFDAIRQGSNGFRRVFALVKHSMKVVSTVIRLVISATISCRISPGIAIMILILAIPSNIFVAKFVKVFWKFYDTTVEKRRKLQKITTKIQSASDIPEYKITNANRYLFKLAHTKGKQLWQEEIDIFTMRFRTISALTFLNIITYVVSPIYLVQLILDGSISIGEFTFFHRKLLDFSGEIRTIISQYMDVSDHLMNVGYVRKIFDLKPVMVDGNIKLKADKPPVIDFQNVSFKYPNSNSYVLKNINLKIKPGEEIAIVGENGAGKTTLIKLLLRFYDTTDGKILINRTPIEKLKLNCYYKLISTLFQEFNTYRPLDVKENIYLGDTSSSINMSMIKKAAKNADADDFIAHLDNKYDQTLSTHFSGGTQLSTGQWQKIALARMFYRNTPILILDEPTASIDAKAEYRIFKKIYDSSKGKTIIIISHRFSTVRNAQHIYVLDKGTIIERGSHNDLMKLNGKYAEAFKLQAQGYKDD